MLEQVQHECLPAQGQQHMHSKAYAEQGPQQRMRTANGCMPGSKYSSQASKALAAAASMHGAPTPSFPALLQLPPSWLRVLLPPHLPLLPHSGVYNDLGSGSNIDLCVISRDGVEYLRNYEFLMGKTYDRKFPVKYPPGTARE